MLSLFKSVPASLLILSIVNIGTLLYKFGTYEAQIEHLTRRITIEEAHTIVQDERYQQIRDIIMKDSATITIMQKDVEAILTTHTAMRDDITRLKTRLNMKDE